jgi:hypothetical protein
MRESIQVVVHGWTPVLVLASFVLSACGSPGDENSVALVGTDSVDVSSVQASLRGGQVTLATGVVAFQISNASGFCTGTMVAPSVLLTAAHCFESVGSLNSSSGPVTFDYIHYYDPVGGIRPVFSGVAQWSVPSSYDGAGPTGPDGSNDDIAIVVIPGTFDATTYHDYVRIYADNIDIDGYWLTAYGAGYHTFSGDDDDSMLRTSAFLVDHATTYHVIIDTTLGKGVCHGDSGGPLIKFANRMGVQTPTITGVLSKMQTENDNDYCGDNTEGHDSAYYCRTAFSRVTWLQDVAGLSCDYFSGSSDIAYRRCFSLPFIEDVAGEGYDLGVATALALMGP